MFDLMEGVHVIEATGGSVLSGWIILIVLLFTLAGIIFTAKGFYDDIEGMTFLGFTALIIAFVVLLFGIPQLTKVQYKVIIDDATSINEVAKQYDVRIVGKDYYYLTEREDEQ